MKGLDLAVIGNCIASALIDPRGRYVWYCYPRFDGDPVFCSLLNGDSDDGFMDVEIADFASSEQHYVGNTAVLSTTLTDAAGGSVRIVDFIPRMKMFDRIFRPTTIIRTIEPVAKSCKIRIRVRPRFDYGATAPTQTMGSNHIRYVSGGTVLRLTTDAPLSYVAGEKWFVLDGPIALILGSDETLAASVIGTARDFSERTQDYWIEWARYLSIPFEWQDAVLRAAITLKLCAFEETGAIVAAMTTSIPESPGSGRTWDYRYCWLRDAYFVVHALNRLGATRTMEDFIRYITNVATLEPDGRLRPVYSIIPGDPMPERIITSLAGYGGEGPVRVGNEAELQIQNDSYGSVVLAAAQMFFDRRVPHPGDINLFERLERLGDRAAECAFTPDAGLWEFRGRKRIHTHSVAMCWAACDRLGKIAHVLGLPDRARHWQGIAVKIRAEILARGWNERRGCFVESLDGEDLDASLLLLPEVGIIAHSDPRFLATLAAIEKELRRGNYIMRYAAPDDFGVPKVSFNVCTFWYVDALVEAGRREEAREIFESLLERRNHLGLISEDIDPVTGTLWGNFPQTYSMVGLVVSAMRLSKSWQEAFWRGSS